MYENTKYCMDWRKAADEWKAWEYQTFGTPDLFITLTRPPFKRTSHIKLGEDGFAHEVTRWMREQLVAPTMSTPWSYAHVLSFREPTGHKLARQHQHNLVRCERLQHLKDDAFERNLFLFQLEASWSTYWERRFGDSLATNPDKLQLQIEWADASRGRVYLLDHHDVFFDILCPHGKTCRRKCWFKKHPHLIGDGWSYDR